MAQQLLRDQKRLQDMQAETGNFSINNSKLQEAEKLALDIEKTLRTRQRERDALTSNGGIPIDGDDRPVEARVDEVLKR